MVEPRIIQESSNPLPSLHQDKVCRLPGCGAKFNTGSYYWKDFCCERHRNLFFQRERSARNKLKKRLDTKQPKV